MGGEASDGGAPAYRPYVASDELGAARMIVASMPGATIEGASGFLRAMEQDERASVYVAPETGELVALYVLRKNGLATDLLLIVVDQDADPAIGLERLAVRDAATRIGKRPLTVETSERALEWYKSLGFKLVGKRKKPDGSLGYRLGWHAPRPGQATAGADGPIEPCPEPGSLLGQQLADGKGQA
ncbi:MAG: hypothetical protein ACR2J8_03760 [Thermomicrobiales bacterium]